MEGLSKQVDRPPREDDTVERMTDDGRPARAGHSRPMARDNSAGNRSVGRRWDLERGRPDDNVDEDDGALAREGPSRGTAQVPNAAMKHMPGLPLKVQASNFRPSGASAAASRSGRLLLDRVFGMTPLVMEGRRSRPAIIQMTAGPPPHSKVEQAGPGRTPDPRSWLAVESSTDLLRCYRMSID